MTAAAEAEGEKEATRRVRRADRGAETGGAILAAVLAMAAYCIGSAGHGIYPFGPRGRAVNDLGNQFVPLHAHLWDLVHGAGGGDLFLNWNSGFGVPFLADFFTYLAYPFSWLVLLFPRSAVDLPIFLGGLLCIGLAAALMTGFLGGSGPARPGCGRCSAPAMACAPGPWTTPLPIRCGYGAWLPCRCCAPSWTGRCSGAAG